MEPGRRECSSSFFIGLSCYLITFISFIVAIFLHATVRNSIIELPEFSHRIRE